MSVVQCEQRADNGNTPMHIAAYKCDLKAMNELLAECTNVDPLNDKKETPLFIAVKKGTTDTDERTAIVRALISKGANVNARNIDGWPVLHMAVAFNKLDCTRLLVSAGADVNAVETEHRATILHWASEGCLGDRMKDMINILLVANANPLLKDIFGCTALHYALESNKFTLDVHKYAEFDATICHNLSYCPARFIVVTYSHAKGLATFINLVFKYLPKTMTLKPYVSADATCPICLKDLSTMCIGDVSVTPCCVGFICKTDVAKIMSSQYIRCPLCSSIEGWQ